MNRLYFEKYANFDRINEPVGVSIPFAKGILSKQDLDKLVIRDRDGNMATSQAVALGLWGDDSVKWAKVDFLANLPANKDAEYMYQISEVTQRQDSTIEIKEYKKMLEINNGCISITLNNAVGAKPFLSFSCDGFSVFEDGIDGPYIIDDNGKKYDVALGDKWNIEEYGTVFCKLSSKGTHTSADGTKYLDFIINITVYANTPWFEVQYRIINRSEPEYVYLKKIALDFYFDNQHSIDYSLATSNYRSNIRTKPNDGADLRFMIDADYLLSDANEQIPETFYGTFFAARSNEGAGGICATLYQAYQNFPKALTVGKKMMSIEILPEEYGQLKYYRGMAKNHKFFLHLYDKNTSIDELNKRSLMLQHMDKPALDPKVYEQSGCYPGIFAKKQWIPFESWLLNKADNRGKAYGMLHWGDSPDAGYSQQGRGGGEHVWTNNEYDFPYAAMQLFARTGHRRLLDYMMVTAEHWAGIDVLHYDPDPLKHGAQIEHSKDHITGPVEISHEWVEGLFAYYYQTGDKFAYDTAIGIGQNILRHLELPKYHGSGGVSARETGWALRALSALYTETNDESWLAQVDFIISHFENWKDTHGGWLAPYTDHTLIRVPFMIGVAVGSLMRYYRIKPEEKIKKMIIDAVDDLCENSILENGLFYYKELQSLRRPGGNPLVLEALACAYELTGNEKYLELGIPTFKLNMGRMEGMGGKKEKIKDGVLMAGSSVKGFAQGFFPMAYFFHHISGTDLLEELK